MKRQRFRLGSVLKHYELQKQRAEQELQRASHALRKIDEEIETLHKELSALAAAVRVDADGSLSAAGWIACSRKSAYLGQCLEKAHAGRARQTELVAKCNETRKRWAIAEETLQLLRRKIDRANAVEKAHANQVELQEMILRRSLLAAGLELGNEDDAPVA
jgi:flagellar biosynthesis chaperone FliJ